MPLPCDPVPEIPLPFSLSPFEVPPKRDAAFVGYCVLIPLIGRELLAGSIALLGPLVPSPLPGTEKAGMNCLGNSPIIVSPCLFFLRYSIFLDRVSASFVSTVASNARLDLINFPTWPKANLQSCGLWS